MELVHGAIGKWPGVQQGQQRGQGLDGVALDQGHAQIARPHAGKGGRHDAGALDHDRLAVAIDQGFERFTAARDSAGQRDLYAGVRRDGDAHRQRGHRIEPGGALAPLQPGIVVVRQRVRGLVVAPQPQGTIGLRLHAGQGVVGVRNKVHRMQRLLSL